MRHLKREPRQNYPLGRAHHWILRGRSITRSLEWVGFDYGKLLLHYLCWNLGSPVRHFCRGSAICGKKGASHTTANANAGSSNGFALHSADGNPEFNPSKNQLAYIFVWELETIFSTA